MGIFPELLMRGKNTKMSTAYYKNYKAIFLYSHIKEVKMPQDKAAKCTNQSYLYING